MTRISHILIFPPRGLLDTQVHTGTLTSPPAVLFLADCGGTEPCEEL